MAAKMVTCPRCQSWRRVDQDTYCALCGALGLQRGRIEADVAAAYRLITDGLSDDLSDDLSDGPHSTYERVRAWVGIGRADVTRAEVFQRFRALVLGDAK